MAVEDGACRSSVNDATACPNLSFKMPFGCSLKVHVETFSEFDHGVRAPLQYSETVTARYHQSAQSVVDSGNSYLWQKGSEKVASMSIIP